MTNLTTNEANKLDNTCGNLRVTKLGTHVKNLEDFVAQNTLSTQADTVSAAINELYAMITNNDCATIQVPPPGFFTLFGDNSTGRLMCYYNDEDHPPVFRHVDDPTASDDGALYLCIADSQGDNHHEILVGNYIAATRDNYYTKGEVDSRIGDINDYITS